ncbi:MAG: copper homeostasis protein CutC [Candidatus Latescibacteria bacterium]|nr:copper homeostasis protein CutC [Candidatus Latescibacterota bacterium]
MNNILCEICVESRDDVLAAQEAGAHRIELCSSLSEGGLTPSAGLIQHVRKNPQLPIHIMIRPRRGDFCYSPLEIDTMIADVTHAKTQGADGIVLGLLNTNGTIDIDHTKQLIKTARPLPITFHRAFDLTRDPIEALDTVITLGIDRILTSGCAPSVEQGIETIQKLIVQAQGRTIIMPGGGINEQNAKTIIQKTQAKEIHFSGRTQIESPMKYRNEELAFSSASQSEYTHHITDTDRIRAILHAAKE